MIVHRLLSIIGLLAISLSMSMAQTFKPANSARTWEYVSTEFFDIYYTGPNEHYAVEAGRFAELSRFELGELFDFRPEMRYTIILAVQPFEILGSNLPVLEGQPNSGLFNLPDRVSYVVHPGTRKDFYHEVKRKVADLILEEFKYGSRLSQTIQSQILLNNPNWFWKGLSDYVGYGWNFEDEMWISSIRNEDALELALDGNSKINRVVFKSIWHYIVHEYGQEKISEIIYLVNVSNSIESGIISVLGIQLATLSERWREYIKDMADANGSKRVKLEDISGTDPFPMKKGLKLTSFAYTEANSLFAMYANQRGQLQLQLFDPEANTISILPIETGFPVKDGEVLDIDLPIAWDRDGERIATTMYQNNQLILAVYDIESKEVQKMAIPSPIIWVKDLTWSEDGDYLALSAVDENGIDIYTHRVGDEGFNAITDDVYDNIQPSWSFDDQLLFFSSNRNSTETGRGSLLNDSHLDHMDLFVYNFGDKSIERLTNTPTVDELQPQPISSFEISYLTDQSGIANVNKLNIFQKSFQQISNLNQGIEQLVAFEKNTAFITPVNGERSLFLLPNGTLHNRDNPSSTLLRDEYDRAYQKRLIEERKNNRPKPTPQPKVEEKKEEEVQANTEAPKEEEGEEKKKKKLRYYLFDEGDDYEVKQPEIESYTRKTPRTYTVFGKKTRPQLREINVSESQYAPTKWSAEYIGWGISYDPLANFGVEMKVGFSDILKNQRLEAEIRPYLNLKNWDANLKYQLLKNRLDIYAEIGAQTRTYRQGSIFFPQDSLIYRYDRYHAVAGVSYPITSTLAVEAEAGFYHLRRVDQQLLRASELQDETDNVLNAGARIKFNNTQDVEGYRFKGFDIVVGMNNYFSTNQSDFVINNTYASIKHYLELKNKIVFASHLSSTISLFNNEQRFYMGGLDDRFLTLSFEKGRELTLTGNPISTDLYDFQFQEFVTPMRGFWFNSRIGTKYVMGNFELRLPLARLLAYTLNSNSMYNLELIPFFDVGSVWTEGNPFSQKNPTDSKIIGSSPVTIVRQTLKSPFLFTVGSGLRANLMGYSVRLDMGWGIDDSTIQKPMMHLSMGKNF